MKYLKITWIRIIISLFSGSLVAELIHISTGDPNRPMPTYHFVLYAVIIFVIFTYIVKKTDKRIM